MKNLYYRSLELRSAVPGSPSPPPFAKIRLRKKLLQFVCLERTLERVPFEQVGLSHPLGASAPFIAERRQPAWNGARGTFPSGAIQAGKPDREPGFERLDRLNRARGTPCRRPRSESHSLNHRNRSEVLVWNASSVIPFCQGKKYTSLKKGNLETGTLVTGTL